MNLYLYSSYLWITTLGFLHSPIAYQMFTFHVRMLLPSLQWPWMAHPGVLQNALPCHVEPLKIAITFSKVKPEEMLPSFLIAPCDSIVFTKQQIVQYCKCLAFIGPTFDFHISIEVMMIIALPSWIIVKHDRKWNLKNMYVLINMIDYNSRFICIYIYNNKHI